MNKVQYTISRAIEDRTEYLYYNEYSNAISWITEQDHSTKFGELPETLKNIVDQLNTFGGSKHEIKLLKVTETIEEV